MGVNSFLLDDTYYTVQREAVTLPLYRCKRGSSSDRSGPPSPTTRWTDIQIHDNNNNNNNKRRVAFCEPSLPSLLLLVLRREIAPSPRLRKTGNPSIFAGALGSQASTDAPRANVGTGTNEHKDSQNDSRGILDGLIFILSLLILPSGNAS